jgi:hypothetical protein
MHGLAGILEKRYACIKKNPEFLGRKIDVLWRYQRLVCKPLWHFL